MTTRSNPYHIKVTAEEMDNFMRGRDEPPPKAASTATPNQTADVFTRWPGWGPVTGLNAFGPGATSTFTTTTTVGRRAWPTLVLIALVVLGVGSLLVALRMRMSVPPLTTAESSYAPPAVAAPVATVVPVPALALTPDPPPVAAYAALPAMTVFCDNVRHEPRSTREVGRLLEATPGWKQRCVAAYGWCTACQDAWYDAHP